MGKRFSELFAEALNQRLGEGSYEGDVFFGWVRKKLRELTVPLYANVI